MKENTAAVAACAHNLNLTHVCVLRVCVPGAGSDRFIS